jgi:hypothetical protein
MINLNKSRLGTSYRFYDLKMSEIERKGISKYVPKHSTKPTQCFTLRLENWSAKVIISSEPDIKFRTF